MSPGRVDTTLALADWLFNFFLVFIFCYLLHTCLTVLNVFCTSSSLRIRGYLLSDHIHHGVRILRLEPYQQSRTDTDACLACSQPHWEDHHWPQRRQFFFALLMTIPDSIDSTLLDPGCTNCWSLRSPWGAFTDPPAARFPRAFFLPSLVRL